MRKIYLPIAILTVILAVVTIYKFAKRGEKMDRDKNSLFLITCGEGRDVSTRYATESRVLEGKTQYKIRGDWFSLPNNCSVSFVDPRKQ